MRDEIKRKLWHNGLIVGEPGRIDRVSAMTGANAIFFVPGSSEEPTGAELDILGAFVLPYIQAHFSPEEIKSRLYAVGANTIVLRKEDGGWRMRRALWGGGPLFVPEEPAPLEEVLKLIDGVKTHH